ncbi:MAG: BatD family protein [Candidatus Gracilibacteria bacterium]|nr:BatD family protein [Candidatus Gracilibacteria bacterium]
MKRRLSLFLVFFFSVSGISYADTKVEVNLETDKKEISTQDTVDLKLIIKQKGRDNIDLGNPTISGIENFDIQGQSSSTQVEMINGDSKSVTSIDYTLKAKKAGNFVIGPVSINFGSGDYQTNQVAIKVNQNAAVNTDCLDGTSGTDCITKNTIENKNYSSLYLAAILLLGFILGLFYNYKRFIKNSPDIKAKKFEKFDLKVNIDDTDFEEKIDEFIRKYIGGKYRLDTSSKTYKEIYEFLKYREDINEENLKVIDSIFSLLIVNKYSSSKMFNREEIITNINALEL